MKNRNEAESHQATLAGGSTLPHLIGKPGARPTNRSATHRRFETRSESADNVHLRGRIFDLEREVATLREQLNAKDFTIANARRDNDILHREIEANYGVLSQIKADIRILEDLSRLDPTSTQRISSTLQHRLVRIRTRSDIHEVTRVTESFIEKLKLTCPSLTGAELQVASFIRVGYNTSAIATTCCICNRTVENHRLRIRRKLGLATEESLAQFLRILDDHMMPASKNE